MRNFQLVQLYLYPGSRPQLQVSVGLDSPWLSYDKHIPGDIIFSPQGYEIFTYVPEGAPAAEAEAILLERGIVACTRRITEQADILGELGRMRVRP